MNEVSLPSCPHVTTAVSNDSKTPHLFFSGGSNETKFRLSISIPDTFFYPGLPYLNVSVVNPRNELNWKKFLGLFTTWVRILYWMSS